MTRNVPPEHHAVLYLDDDFREIAVAEINYGRSGEGSH